MHLVWDLHIWRRKNNSVQITKINQFTLYLTFAGKMLPWKFGPLGFVNTTNRKHGKVHKCDGILSHAALPGPPSTKSSKPCILFWVVIHRQYFHCFACLVINIVWFNRHRLIQVRNETTLSSHFKDPHSKSEINLQYHFCVCNTYSCCRHIDIISPCYQQRVSCTHTFYKWVSSQGQQLKVREMVVYYCTQSIQHNL